VTLPRRAAVASLPIAGAQDGRWSGPVMMAALVIVQVAWLVVLAIVLVRFAP
jgi:hypothetical protein